MELLEEHRCFEGRQQRWRHDSTVLNCAMTFSIFLPPTGKPAGSVLAFRPDLQRRKLHHQSGRAATCRRAGYCAGDA